MGLPKLQTCCFVLDLKTGNIVMGCLNAFLSFVMFVIMIVVSVGVGTAQSDEEKMVQEVPTPSLVNVEEDAVLTGLYAMTVILVLMFLAKLLFDLFFVYGVITERKAAIKAYFIMWLVFFLLSAFTFSINLPSYSAGTICSEIFYIGINIYCILLSYSFYTQLNEREEV